jgi:Uncharacterized metal-binding protein
LGNIYFVRVSGAGKRVKMKEYSVTILPENIIVQVSEGTNLLMAAKKAGIDIESPCGGNGTCGKCAVKVVEGNPGEVDVSHLPDELREMGMVPACMTRVTSDLTVEVPGFSRLTKHKVVLGTKRTKYGKENDYFSSTPMNPLAKKIRVKLDIPGADDSLNDLDRLKNALLRQYGIKNAGIQLAALRQLPQALRQGNWEVTLTVANAGDIVDVIRVEPGKSQRPAYGLAVDIGTTTVVVNLLELDKGSIIGRSGTYNKQAVYGSDVISRIIYTEENNNGAELLQKAVISTINQLIEEILASNAVKRDEVAVMVCAGNTVMMHLFMKVSAGYLRLEPYIPGAVSFPVVKAGELGISINKDAHIVSVPSVASYVGGDITAGVLATMIGRSDKLTLFIDVGTNGELVLGNNEWLVTCSCSAGPAFEGSGISCGMRAMDGAIDWIDIDRTTLEVSCRTIGDVKPLGICGSGLIYSLSEMMDAGIIDRAGQIMAFDSPRIREGSGGTEFVLVFAKDSGGGQDIVVTEGDIKNLLRAKGAIFAGIRTMLSQLQLDVSTIERVYIAGGFGNYINITDAVNIGMLPDLPSDMFEYVGNSCIQGAMLVLLCREALVEAGELAAKMTYIELSLGNLFMEEFISAVFIPHTDLNLFPTVKNKVRRHGIR